MDDLEVFRAASEKNQVTSEDAMIGVELTNLLVQREHSNFTEANPTQRILESVARLFGGSLSAEQLFWWGASFSFHAFRLLSGLLPLALLLSLHSPPSTTSSFTSSSLQCLNSRCSSFLSSHRFGLEARDSHESKSAATAAVLPYIDPHQIVIDPMEVDHF